MPVPLRLKIVYWYLASRALLVLQLSLGLAIPAGVFGEPPDVYHHFIRWDAGWYLSIIDDGYSYVPGKESSVAFFPVYPMTVRLLASVFGHSRFLALLVSNAALFGAAWFIGAIAYRFWRDEKIAALSVLFFLLAPATIFYSGIYTESFFVLFCSASIYFALSRRWWLAGMSGALATGTRTVGIALVLALLFEYFTDEHGKLGWRKPGRDVLALALVPVGLVAYMIYQWHTFGDALAFSEASKAWGRHFAPPWVSLLQMRRFHPEYNLLVVFALVFTAIGLVTVYRERKVLFVFGACVTLLCLSSNMLESQSRYLSSVFPAYFGVAKLAARWPIVERSVLAVSVLLLANVALRFARGYLMV